MIKRFYRFVLLPFVVCAIHGCQCSFTPESDILREPPINPISSTNSTFTESSSPSVGIKSIRYFNYEGKPVESSNSRGANYYRLAYYIDGKPNPDSLAIDYYLSGERKAEGHILSENPDVFDGERITYYKNGPVESTQTFNNGVPVSDYTVYREDGTLYSFTEYENGIPIKHTSYEKDGKRENIYKEGKWYQQIRYYANGLLESRLTFEDPNQDSFIGEYYYESGKLKSKARYVKRPDFTYDTIGDVYLYDENGNLTIKNHDPKPVFTNSNPAIKRRQRSSDWDRGYDYGWSAGYQDGVDGNEKWYSYDDSRKGGDFLDGYTSGYESGYENGRREWREDNDVEEDEDYY